MAGILGWSNEVELDGASELALHNSNRRPTANWKYSAKVWKTENFPQIQMYRMKIMQKERKNK